jgi:hypothetical protein
MATILPFEMMRESLLMLLFAQMPEDVGGSAPDRSLVKLPSRRLFDLFHDTKENQIKSSKDICRMSG